MSEIELQVVGKDFKYFFVRNRGSKDQFEQDKIKKELDHALKLQELVKEIIDYLMNYFPTTETWTLKELLEELQSLVEESEK